MLEVSHGRAGDDDLTSVTTAVAGIAETGTLMLGSGAGTPTTLNFLPDNHIVVLRRGQVLGTYEAAWDRLRRAGALPPAANFVPGPPRTGDLEPKTQPGAHSPLPLHNLFIEP